MLALRLDDAIESGQGFEEPQRMEGVTRYIILPRMIKMATVK